MKIFTLITALLFVVKCSGQLFNLGLNISNPIRDTQVGWFDIDEESFDGYNLNNKSIAFELNSLYAFEKFDLRLRFNYMSINILEYQDVFISGIRTQENVHGVQNKFSIAPGLFRSLDFDKLILSFGFEAIYSSHGQFKIDMYTKQTNISSGNLIYDYYGTAIIPSGFTFGIGTPFIFGFKFGKRFIIQAEYSPSLYYAKLGGTTMNTSYSNTPIYIDYGTTYTEDFYKGFSHSEHRFSFGIIYWIKL